MCKNVEFVTKLKIGKQQFFHSTGNPIQGIMLPETHKLEFPDHSPGRSRPGWGCRWG